MESKADNYSSLFSQVGNGLTQNAIRKLSPLIARPDIISFAAGAPSAEVFPAGELAEIASRVIRDRGRAPLQYGPTRGNNSLLELIAEETRLRGIAVKGPSQLVITTGSQQGLDLISRILIDPGDIALVELPSYVGGTIALHNSRAELWGVRQDAGGIVVEDVDECLERAMRLGRRVKCLYTIPNFQNPSGVTLAAERRTQIGALAAHHDFIIIEDDPYGELYFSREGPLAKPIAAEAPNRVVYLSSFSKTLAPGLRIAWLCAPEEIASKIELAKEGADLSSSQLDMAIVAAALSSGLVRARLPILREFYSQRCKVILDALEENLPAAFDWTKPIGGFFVMLETPAGIDTAELLPRAIESGVAYVPGRPFFVNGSGATTMRLAFSKEPPDKIKEGIARLGRVLKESVNQD